ncbi:MAG: DUF4179 domain-containing protein [Lachnospiraceae bacterium]|nr:DUF4179 domain-containing protein [Lachnospiraceae bacterium]
MKDNMYTLLNDMDIQVDSYEVSEVSSKEVKDWKRTFRQKQSGEMRKKRYVGRYVAVVALVLVCTLAFEPFQGETYAQIKNITYSVQEMLGMETDLSSYETIVGKTIAKDGVTITVNDVVMDRAEMVVSYTVTAENFDDTMDNYYLDVQVNGKSVFGGSAGECWMADENNMVSIERVCLDDVDVEKENYYKLIFYVHEEQADEGIVEGIETKKVGSVEFSASGEQLAAETVFIALDEPYEFPNGDKLRFVMYSYNTMGPKIYCELDTHYVGCDVRLRGADDLGNKLEFYLTYFNGDGDSWFVLEPEEDNYIRKDATSLTLSVFAVGMPEQSGEIGNDYQKIGEPFTIPLK